MIARKFDKEVAALHNRLADADRFTASYNEDFVSVDFTHDNGFYSHIMMGEYKGSGCYFSLTCFNKEGVREDSVEFATFAELLTYLGGGKAA